MSRFPQLEKKLEKLSKEIGIDKLNNLTAESVKHLRWLFGSPAYLMLAHGVGKKDIVERADAIFLRDLDGFAVEAGKTPDSLSVRILSYCGDSIHNIRERFGYLEEMEEKLSRQDSIRSRPKMISLVGEERVATIISEIYFFEPAYLGIEYEIPLLDDWKTKSGLDKVAEHLKDFYQAFKD